ncbi:MAG: acyl-CoA dehydrogenase family protein [Myxococcota bacterium]
MIDFEPSEEQALIIETVHQFAENEIRPRGREADESGVPAPALLAAAHELGLVANGLPEADGGGGARSALTGALVAEELGWGDMALALAILSPGLVGFPVADHGSEALRRRVLPGLLGPAFVPGALALVEPRFDFDPFRPQTTARRDGDGHRLDGHKCHVPWLPGGRHVVVIAREAGASTTGAQPTPGSAATAGPLAAFVVDREAAGLRAVPEQNMGLCGLPTVELVLEGVRVSAEDRLAASDADVRRLIDRGRIAIAATALGAARAAYEAARDYAKQRETFGQPIATRQAIAFKLADMAIEIDGARLLVWEAAAALDAGEDASRRVRLAQDQTARVGLAVADSAVQVYGGHGYVRDYLPEMSLRNLAGLASYEALALV